MAGSFSFGLESQDPSEQCRKSPGKTVALSSDGLLQFSWGLVNHVTKWHLRIVPSAWPITHSLQRGGGKVTLGFGKNSRIRVGSGFLIYDALHGEFLGLRCFDVVIY